MFVRQAGFFEAAGLMVCDSALYSCAAVDHSYGDVAHGRSVQDVVLQCGVVYSVPSGQA